MGHNSQQGYFLGQELLLDFAAWIDLTSNSDYIYVICQLGGPYSEKLWQVYSTEFLLNTATIREVKLDCNWIIFA